MPWSTSELKLHLRVSMNYRYSPSIYGWVSSAISTNTCHSIIVSNCQHCNDQHHHTLSDVLYMIFTVIYLELFIQLPFLDQVLVQEKNYADIVIDWLAIDPIIIYKFWWLLSNNIVYHNYILQFLFAILIRYFFWQYLFIWSSTSTVT